MGKPRSPTPSPRCCRPWRNAPWKWPRRSRRSSPLKLNGASRNYTPNILGIYVCIPHISYIYIYPYIYIYTPIYIYIPHIYIYMSQRTYPLILKSRLSHYHPYSTLWTPAKLVHKTLHVVWLSSHQMKYQQISTCWWLNLHLARSQNPGALGVQIWY